MAYNELLKDINRIRSFIRDFYVFGFYSRDEYASLYQISSRSYDNERRRVESWMQEYLMFYHDSQGKKVFLAIDANTILHNPLYRAFKAKSFTANDVMLHFYLMDLFSDGQSIEQTQIEDLLCNNYPEILENMPDMKTIRLKLEDLTRLGLLKKEKRKRAICYQIISNNIDLSHPGFWHAMSFFSEEAPMGLIGSFLLDKKKMSTFETKPHCFRFRHHYLMQAIDSEIMCELLLAIDEHRWISMRVDSVRQGSMQYTALPLKIFISTENGREYLLTWNGEAKRFYYSRIDRIIWIKQLKKDSSLEMITEEFRLHRKYLWGVSFGSLESVPSPAHLELELTVKETESFIVNRLQREKRNGTVKKIDDNRYLFTVDLYDPEEILPWICTFTGRILRLECDNKNVLQKYQQYLTQMASYYVQPGSLEDAVSNAVSNSVSDYVSDRSEDPCAQHNIKTAAIDSDCIAERSEHPCTQYNIKTADIGSDCLAERSEDPCAQTYAKPRVPSYMYRPRLKEQADTTAASKAKTGTSSQSRRDLVFHEVYGAYYNALARILSLAVQRQLTPGKLFDIVQDKAFGESTLNLPDRLLSGEWPFLNEKLQTNLKREPAMPLTKIQKRWLRALIDDPRLKLFLDDASIQSLTEGLKDIRPLYTQDTFCCFDRFTDGDPWQDPDYIRIFKTIVSAISDRRCLSVQYRNKYGEAYSMDVIPHYIEYSAREDKFRLYADQADTGSWDEPLRLNISRIQDCKIASDLQWTDAVTMPRRESAVIELTDQENTLERAMFHFSYLEKKTERLDHGTFRITLYYAKADETEILIRILSFGHQLRIISEGALKDHLTNRILAQMKLLPVRS